MRIAWFHSHLLHANSGGTRFVIDYAAGMVKNFNSHVTLFVDVASPEARQSLAEKNIELVELDTCSTNSPFYYLALPRRIKSKRRQLKSQMVDFDVCVNSMFPMNVLTAGFAMPKVQICYEPFAFFYDVSFLTHFKWYHRAFFRMLRHLYMHQDKRSLHAMDKVLTVNETNISKFEAIYNMRPEVVYAGIDTELYHRAGQDDILATRQQHPGHPILFHSTDLTGIKGSFQLLDVIAILKERYPAIKLLFTIYVNNPEGTQKFLRRIAELGLQNNCEFLGCLPKGQLPLYYSAVDFVCQPSVNQPANWPLKEALLCGTPIIGGVESEEVDEMVNGIRIDVNAREAAAAKLDMLFQSQASLKVDSRELVERYSFVACLGKLNRVLEECCADYSRHA